MAIVAVVTGTVSRLHYGETHEDLIYIGCDNCIGELHERVDRFGPLQVSSSSPFRCSLLWSLNTKWRIPMGHMRVDLRARPECPILDETKVLREGESAFIAATKRDGQERHLAVPLEQMKGE
jgi:hypothetical protein